MLTGPGALIHACWTNAGAMLSQAVKGMAMARSKASAQGCGLAVEVPQMRSCSMSAPGRFSIGPGGQGSTRATRIILRGEPGVGKSLVASEVSGKVFVSWPSRGAQRLAFWAALLNAKLGRHLGGGAEGDVYEAEDKRFVVKVAKQGNEELLGKEYSLYQIAQGLPNVASPVAYNGSRMLMKRLSEPTLPDALRLAKDMERALKGLHSRGILHGDVHLGNAMYDEENKEYVLIDLGQNAAEFKDSAEGAPGKGGELHRPPLERSPEPKMYPKSDFYRLACMIEEAAWFPFASATSATKRRCK